MWKRKRTWFLLLALISIALAVYFEPTRCVRGRLHGEAFFDGRPTSWWRGELERWEIAGAFEVHLDHEPPDRKHRLAAFSRESTWIETFQDRWLGRKRVPIQNGPKVLGGGPGAEEVLRGLLDDPSPKVRRYAAIGLGADPEFSASIKPSLKNAK